MRHMTISTCTMKPNSSASTWADMQAVLVTVNPLNPELSLEKKKKKHNIMRFMSAEYCSPLNVGYQSTQ